jgi:hypothetical protein
VFAGFAASRLRTSLARACRAAAVPLFSPQDLLHRRISLLHLGGVPWAKTALKRGSRRWRFFPSDEVDTPCVTGVNDRDSIGS